ncbi:hypothetical protein F2Q69_00052495 [Brassica cretica]|uniref:Protein kinase domain-containing protein n=1 Tax=Brassica cretica TaxID=69181 RepID=A0A8S9MWV5_BRACR|nr:hypothetical protein F2Q69_00052495 [Brassica cretica]
MADFTLTFSDFKEGRRSTTVEIRLLRFWESISLLDEEVFVMNKDIFFDRFDIKDYVTGFKDLEPVCEHPTRDKAYDTRPYLSSYTCISSIVYEYMENGTLKDHLYASDNPRLSWRHRIEACVGAARGLHYLHIDFLLPETGPDLYQTHVGMPVKGSFGYFDPNSMQETSHWSISSERKSEFDRYQKANNRKRKNKEVLQENDDMEEPLVTNSLSSEN